jgi:diacylglycerol O-acyltransferase
MGRSHYERLSALDASFLALETPSAHMQVAVVAVFEAGPLATPAGGVDIERIRNHLARTLDRIPRYRQRLVFTPLERHPVWVDDPEFSLSYHLRHTSLPRPGNVRQLKRLAGQIMSQKLDRSKPLWEIWVVEGLEHGRFALITQAHHSMVDGIAGVDVLTALFRPEEEGTEPGSSRWRPRPVPGASRLLAGELARRGRLARSMARGLLHGVADPRRAAAALGESAGSLLDLTRGTLAPASRTPLNPDAIGPHRHFDWVRFDLGTFKAVKARLGGTVNDVVLATVAGALRRYLQRHGLWPDEVDFRVLVPVSTRPAGDHGSLGNRVASVVVRLPLDEPEPLVRYRRVTETTRALKASNQVRGVAMVEELADRTSAALLTGLMRFAAQWRTGNMVVTNVPGPDFPLAMLGAPLLECYPLVPLFTNQALGIALFSYAGGLYWGFNADRYAVRDLHDLVDHVVESFASLEKAAIDAGGLAVV